MLLPESGWKLLIQANADPLVRHTAEDLREFLQVAMQVEVNLETRDSLYPTGEPPRHQSLRSHSLFTLG